MVTTSGATFLPIWSRYTGTSRSTAVASDDRVPLAVDGVSSGERRAQLAGARPIGGCVLHADVGEARQIEIPGQGDRRLVRPVVRRESGRVGSALGERPRDRRSEREP